MLLFTCTHLPPHTAVEGLLIILLRGIEPNRPGPDMDGAGGPWLLSPSGTGRGRLGVTGIFLLIASSLSVCIDATTHDSPSAEEDIAVPLC